MPVTAVTTDPENLTMTLTAELAAPVECVWRAFTDPRQLDRFWGPPTWPARFTHFDLQVGGLARYAMTGPEGELSAGRWEFLAIEPPHRFEVIDSFTDAEGNVIAEMPSMRMTFVFEPVDGGTRLVNVTYFTDLATLEKVVAMGAVEGSTMAMNQLDQVLLDLRELSRSTELEIVNDTLVRVSRVIHGPAELVWRAHTEEALLRRWMLGPDGWEMTDCEPPTTPGERYRWGWRSTTGEGEPFGFEGEVLIAERPRRLVTTERMVGVEGPGTVNDMSLYEEDGLTLLTLYIGYPDKDTRDMVLATGMVDGMEASYARMESVLA